MKAEEESEAFVTTTAAAIPYETGKRLEKMNNIIASIMPLE